MNFAMGLLGLVFGSFLNVLIWRLNDEKAPKWWKGRSMCPTCKHTLSWKDNIPLVSFVALGRRCRRCRTHISWRYPVVELVTAVSFYVIGFQPQILALAAIFIVIFFSDWIYGFIPDEMILVGLLFCKVTNLYVAFFAGLAFLLIVLLTRFRGMGLGDVKLAFLMGFLLGWPNILVAVWIAFVLGGLVALILLGLKRVGFSDKIAFGPYLVLGTLVSALWSQKILTLLSLSL